MIGWIKKLFSDKKTVLEDHSCNDHKIQESELLEGWTDDMTFPLPNGVTEETLVSQIIKNALDGTIDDENAKKLVNLGISEDDAYLALDRVFGGIVRGATNNPANCPDKNKDPLAWLSFSMVINDMSIAKRIYPQYFDEK